MSRRGSSGLAQKIGMISQRMTFQAPALALGTIASYDPSTHMATATIDYGDGFTYTTPPSQIMTSWHGSSQANGPYSDSGAPEVGVQCLVGCIDRDAHVFMILGMMPTDDASGIGVPSGEKKILDKRGSYISWSADGGGTLYLVGAKRVVARTGSLSITLDSGANTVTIVGANGSKLTFNADGTIEEDATTLYLNSNVVFGGTHVTGGLSPVARQSDLQALEVGMRTQANAQFANCQSGSGVGQMAETFATGSSKASSA